jgi:hypothetical protein
MKRSPWLVLAVLSFATFLSCGLGTSNNCAITANTTPRAATADHSAPPGNQVQFSLQTAVEGMCPMVADQLGSWSTSDPINTTISNDASTDGLATCLNATPGPVTITNSSRVRGKTYPSASLTCN